jgi:hypothetical protein
MPASAGEAFCPTLPLWQFRRNAIAWVDICGRRNLRDHHPPRWRQLGVDLRILLQSGGNILFEEDGVGRTLGYAQGTVDAVFRVNRKKAGALMKAIERTHHNAVGVFALDAMVGDDVSHGCEMLVLTETEISLLHVCGRSASWQSGTASERHRAEALPEAGKRGFSCMRNLSGITYRFPSLAPFCPIQPRSPTTLLESPCTHEQVGACARHGALVDLVHRRVHRPCCREYLLMWSDVVVFASRQMECEVARWGLTPEVVTMIRLHVTGNTAACPAAPWKAGR